MYIWCFRSYLLQSNQDNQYYLDNWSPSLYTCHCTSDIFTADSFFSSVVFHQKKSVFLQVEWWWKKWAMNTPAGPIHFSSYRYAKYADNSKWYHVGIAKVPKIHFAWQRRPHGSVVLNNIRYPKSSCIQKA